MTRRRGRCAGGALVEFVIVIPVLVILLFFGMYFSDLIRARFKIMEISRYAAFEMTSYALTDYATGSHNEAFVRASNHVGPRSVQRWEGAKGPLSDLDVRIENSAVPLSESTATYESGGGWAGAILKRLNGGVNKAVDALQFNPQGAIQAEASASLRNGFVPRRLLRAGRGGRFFSFRLTGGMELAQWRLKGHYFLVAADWHLPDGRDSVMGEQRAGVDPENGEPTLLYRQVSRMAFLGAKDRFAQLPGVSAALAILRSVAPDPIGTYVVSHNYGLPAQNVGCKYLQHYPERARGGLNNLASHSVIDDPRPACFDTAPFRDQADYQDSLYIKMFEARGNWFMGCKNSQADDPTGSSELLAGDSLRVKCG